MMSQTSAWPSRSPADEEHALGRRDREDASRDRDPDRRRGGASSVEEEAFEDGLAHRPMSHPKKSTAPSPVAERSVGKLPAATASSGAPASTVMHSSR